MKYGKLLTRARRLSNPTWQACWLDYHDLKGMIYTITGKKKKKNGFSSEDEELSSAVETTTVKDQHSSAAAKSSSSSNDGGGGGGGGGSSNRNSNTSDTTTATSQHSSSQRQQHSQQQPQQHQHHQQHNNNSSTDSGAVSTVVVVVVNPASVPLPVEQDEKSAVSTEQSRAFFERLRQELRKVSNFYNTQESILLNRTAQFAQELTAAELQHIDEKDAEEKETRVITLSRLMESCKVLYVDLMMLENFAVMNYGGFAKILKKHDKNTSFITQERYLRKVVNVKPFALYEQLKKAISLSEQAFTRLVNMIPSDIDNGSDGSDGEHSRTGPTVQSTFLSSESSSSVLSGRTERTGRSNSGSSPKRNFSSNELSTLTSLREIAEAGQKISPSVSPSIIRAQSPAAKVTASMGAIAASTAAKRKHIIHEASHVVETNSDNNKKRKVEQ